MNGNSGSRKVSVIIPTYNYGKYIKEAVTSVLAQTCRNLEIIIIDNHSEDQTEQIISSFGSELIKYCKFRNHGIIAASRNYGISQAKGEFIAFLDADDAWCPTKLEEQLVHFQDKGLVGVGTDAVIRSDTPYYRQLDFGRSRQGYNDYDYENIISANPIKTSSVVVREDVIKSVGGFDENPKFRCIEDYELWLRMSRFGKFRILEKKLFFYRMHYDQSRRNIEIAINTKEIFAKHVGLGYLSNPKIIDEAEATADLSIGFNYLFSDGHEAKDYYLKAFRKSSKMGKRIKSLVGYSLAIQPLLIRNPVNLLFHKIDKIFDYIKIRFKFKR